MFAVVGRQVCSFPENNIYSFGFLNTALTKMSSCTSDLLRLTKSMLNEVEEYFNSIRDIIKACTYPVSFSSTTSFYWRSLPSALIYFEKKYPFNDSRIDLLIIGPLNSIHFLSIHFVKKLFNLFIKIILGWLPSPVVFKTHDYNSLTVRNTSGLGNQPNIYLSLRWLFIKM